MKVEVVCVRPLRRHRPGSHGHRNSERLGGHGVQSEVFQFHQIVMLAECRDFATCFGHRAEELPSWRSRSSICGQRAGAD
jgi:hypothetical protein